MKKEETIFENEFTKEGVSMFICNDLNAKTTILTYLLYEQAIKKNREVLCYTFERRADYYYRHLLSYISKINKTLLAKYLYPWLGLSHNNTDMINRFYFVDAIEKIQQSNLFLIGENTSPNIDYLDSILEMLEFDTSTMIVIEDFDLLLQKTKYNRKETLKRLNDYSQKYEAHIILISDTKHAQETNTILISSLLPKEKQTRMLEMKTNSNTIHIEYDKNNYEIKKKEVDPHGTNKKAL